MLDQEKYGFVFINPCLWMEIKKNVSLYYFVLTSPKLDDSVKYVTPGMPRSSKLDLTLRTLRFGNHSNDLILLVNVD
jgi:hypothetical protein